MEDYALSRLTNTGLIFISTTLSDFSSRSFNNFTAHSPTKEYLLSIDVSVGVDLAVTNVTAGEMGFTMVDVTTPYNSDAIKAAGENPNSPGGLNQQSKN